MELLAKAKAERGMAILLITHDLGMVAEFADRVAIMYAGRIMEIAAVRDAVRRAPPPLHPAACSAACRNSARSAGG